MTSASGESVTATVLVETDSHDDRLLSELRADAGIEFIDNWDGQRAELRALRPRAGDLAWRLSFVLGMLVAPLLYMLLAGPVKATVDAGWDTVLLAGLLVGVGTRYGAGCTSGHGVCGLSRLSPRSLVATMAFMGAGFVVVFLLRHALSA